jgi:hypothetical protein
LASSISCQAAIDRFLESLDARDISAWAVPNGRLYRRFTLWGFAISSVRDLRPDLADYDIDGEVTMLVPRTRLDVTLRQSDFALVLRYQVWDFHGLISPRQQMRAGGATELHLKAHADPADRFLIWLEQTLPHPQSVSDAVR